jgi:hypothetical protein
VGAARGLSCSAMQRLVLAYVNGQRPRFDHRLREILTRCNEWLGKFHDDALILSFAAFGGLDSTGWERATALNWGEISP